MKVYISVDIEGVAGITHWDEATIGKPGYETFREQMTAEAAAACEGALAAGATGLLVKDAHSSGRNILPACLPESVQLIRSWSGDPLCMVEELDESFDAVAMVGYHSGAGFGGNPLAHVLVLVVHPPFKAFVESANFLEGLPADASVGGVEDLVFEDAVS